MTFTMVDDVNNISESFTAYQVYNIGAVKFTSVDQVEAGDVVVLHTQITNYYGTPESTGKGTANLYSSTNEKAVNGGGTSGGGGDTPDPSGLTGDGSESNPYTANDVIALANTKTGSYYVKGYIVGQIAGGATGMSGNTEYAAPFTANSNNTNTNILIATSATETTDANVVPVQLPTGALRDGLNLIANSSLLGQEVIIYGSLEKYFGQAGVKSPVYAKVGTTELGLKPGAEIVEPTATAVTVAEFIAAAESNSVYYELTGTIGTSDAHAEINTTYGNFILTDATGSVYIYGLNAAYTGTLTADKSYSTLGLQAGDNITIRGVRGSYQGEVEMKGGYFVRKN